MRTLTALLLAILPSCSWGQQGLAGYDRFPQFRGLSGLAGGGFGVDAGGWASLSGPVAYSTPTAYVLGHSQVRLLGGTISSSRSASWNYRSSNGTGVLMYGHSFPRINVALSAMVLSRIVDQAYNLQLQYAPQTPAPVALSVGEQDISGKGGSSGTGIAGDARKSRSFFVAATAPLGNSDSSLYVSGGIGTRRFRKGFASASYRVLPPLRGWVEYDGFGTNLGVLAAHHFARVEGRPIELTAVVGYVKGDLFTFSLGVGF